MSIATYLPRLHVPHKNEFYYKQDWLEERGYIRSVVYYFKKGDSFENCGSDGYHVKAYVEHYFTSDTNVTLDYFKQWQKNVLGSSGNNGLLSDTFKLTPITNLQCKKQFHNKVKPSNFAFLTSSLVATGPIFMRVT